MIVLFDIRLDGSLLDGSGINATLSEDTQSGALIGELSGGTDFTLLDDAGGAVFLDGNQLRLSETAVLDDMGQPQLTVTLQALDAQGQTVTVEVLIGVEAAPSHETFRGSVDGDEMSSDNPGRDFFIGAAGNDTIHANGSDVVVLTGSRMDYAIDTAFIPFTDGSYGGTYETTVQDLRDGGADDTDLILTGGAVGFRFADGDYRLDEIMDSDTPAQLTLDGRVLEVDKLIAEDQGPGVIGQLGLRGQPGAVPGNIFVEVLAFNDFSVFPDTLDPEFSPFAIDENGVLSLTEVLDYEVYQSYALRIFYEDAAGNNTMQIIEIQTLDRDDAPVLVSAPGLDEPFAITNFTDVSSDLLVGTLFADDPDGTAGVLTFVLGGADADKFYVQDGNLFLIAGTVINTGAPFDFDLTVTLEDSALGAGAAIDLDIRVSVPNPLDALRWDFVAPSDIKVFIQPGGMTILEDYLLFQNPDAGFVSLEFSAAQVTAIQAAFGLFSAVANLTFTFVSTLAEADFAMIAAPGLDGALADWAVAGGTLTADGEAVALDGWGRFDMSDFGSASFVPGTEAFYALIHEIGHGLGLAHPHDTGGGSVVMEGVVADFGSVGAFDLNQAIYTMMSYNRGWASGALGQATAAGTGHGASPAALDIAVLQEKYGANTTTHAGNDIYDLGDTSHVTIWDTAGIDRIRYQGAVNAVISLEAATLDYTLTGGGVVSYLEMTRGGFTIAAGVEIEEAQGGTGNDILFGNAGRNKLIGGSGDDWLSGGAGNDLLAGGGGIDLLEGGEGIDTVSYQASAWRVNVDLATGLGRLGQAAGDRLTGIEALTGSRGNDWLAGNDGSNTLRGGAGDDTLLGRQGDDVLAGGLGADRLDGGDGIDRVTYASSAEAVHVDLGARAGFGGEAEGDLLLRIEDVHGSAHGDDITGAAGANWLIGAAGDDTLRGAGGDDRLAGGTGADVFVFDLGDGHDRITDFGADDLIMLTAALWDSLGLETFEDLVALHATQVGARVDLAFGAFDVLQLDGTNLADLVPDRFAILAVIS